MIDLISLIGSDKVTIDKKHDWGYQLRCVNTELYCGKFMVLTNDMFSSLHYHKEKDETFMVMKGIVWLEIIYNSNLRSTTLYPGDSYRIEPNTKHRFKSLNGLSVILEVSTHDDDNDTYRVLK